MKTLVDVHDVSDDRVNTLKNGTVLSKIDKPADDSELSKINPYHPTTNTQTTNEDLISAAMSGYFTPTNAQGRVPINLITKS